VALSRARDVLVTGLGFCLPGPDQPVFAPADLWNLTARGRTALRAVGGVPYGQVVLSAQAFTERWPDVPGVFADHFSDVQRYGLVALAEACQDAKLDLRAGDLTEAAILVGRGGVDSNVAGYRAVHEMDPTAVRPEQAMDLFLGGEMTSTPADVALVQSAVTRSTGPCFTAAAGCASSSVQINTARLLIEAGEIERAVVTGVDAFDPALAINSRALIEALQGGSEAMALPTDLGGLMRPYDQRAGTINFGAGAATVVLESRAAAEGRGGHSYGQILAQSIRRDGLPHPLTGDRTGVGLATAIRQCLSGGRELPPYVHGGEICPTTNCEQPADLPFDPVPGTATRRLDFDRALCLSYQIGGTKSVILVGGTR
jgi:3-oxoacyl-[acyl-carrier-protein] synthase II